MAAVAALGMVVGAETWLRREPSRVAIAPPANPDAAELQACTRLLERLPAALDGARRRLVTPVGALVAAYGDPPITMRCAVARPPALRPTDEAVEVDGVAWFLQKQPEGYRFTTVGRVAYLEVTVPAHYRPEVNPLLDLAGPVREALPRTGPTSAGVS